MTKLAAWQILDQATAFRKHLLHAGMYPLPAIGKRIPVDNWTALQVTETEIDSWFQRYPEARNTGVLTRTTPAVDIDVHDADMADEIEALLWDMIGTRGLVRFGQRPKRACLFRTEKPFNSMLLPGKLRISQKSSKVRCEHIARLAMIGFLSLAMTGCKGLSKAPSTPVPPPDPAIQLSASRASAKKRSNEAERGRW